MAEHDSGGVAEVLVQALASVALRISSGSPQPFTIKLALSRRKQGFESPRERQLFQWLNLKLLFCRSDGINTAYPFMATLPCPRAIPKISTRSCPPRVFPELREKQGWQHRGLKKLPPGALVDGKQLAAMLRELAYNLPVFLVIIVRAIPEAAHHPLAESQLSGSTCTSLWSWLLPTQNVTGVVELSTNTVRMFVSDGIRYCTTAPVFGSRRTTRSVCMVEAHSSPFLSKLARYGNV